MHRRLNASIILTVCGVLTDWLVDFRIGLAVRMGMRDSVAAAPSAEEGSLNFPEMGLEMNKTKQNKIC